MRAGEAHLAVVEHQVEAEHQGAAAGGGCHGIGVGGEVGRAPDAGVGLAGEVEGEGGEGEGVLLRGVWRKGRRWREAREGRRAIITW